MCLNRHTVFHSVVMLLGRDSFSLRAFCWMPVCYSLYSIVIDFVLYSGKRYSFRESLSAA